MRADAARVCSQTLSKHRLLSAPVLCATSDACAADEGAFEGFCDVAAILHHVLSALDPTLLEEDGATTTDDIVRVMDALTALAPDALEAPVSAVSRNDGDLIYRGYESCSLLDIITAGFVHPFHLRDVAICHRVRCGQGCSGLHSVIEVFRAPQLAAADVRPELDAATSLSDVSARSMSIISHMDLIKCAGHWRSTCLQSAAGRTRDACAHRAALRFLHRRVDELGPLADASVQALGLAAPNMFVFAVPGSEPAVCVLLELDEHKLSAAGVVNSDGELVANLSVSDLRDVPADQFGLLACARYCCRNNIGARLTPALYAKPAGAAGAGVPVRARQLPQAAQRGDGDDGQHAARRPTHHGVRGAAAARLRLSQECVRLMSCGCLAGGAPRVRAAALRGDSAPAAGGHHADGRAVFVRHAAAVGDAPCWRGVGREAGHAA